MSIATDNRKLWLEERRKTIGASDCYKIMGLAPFGKPDEVERKLWLGKMGLDADDDNQAIRMGQFLQHGVAMEALARIGGSIEQEEPFAIHSSVPWASATPDYILRTGDRQAILEVKVTSREPWDIVPDAYVLQCHWQAWVHNIDTAYLAALHGSTEVRVYEIPIDLESRWFRKAVDECKYWFEKHVVNGEEPTRSEFHANIDAKLIREEIRAESGRIQNLDDMKYVLLSLIELKAQAKEIESRIKMTEDQIKESMGKAEVGTIDGQVVVTWKESVSKSFDPAKAKQALGDKAGEFTTEKVSRRFLLKEKALA